MARILIRGAAIVSMDPAVGDLPRGDVLIDGETIAAVAPAIAVQDARVIDGTGMVCMPGLINAHIHTWEVGLRGIGANWCGAQYYQYLHHNMTSLFEPEDNYVANLVGALSQINGGVTTMFDWCHNLRTPDQTDASIDGLEESGIRAVFGHGTTKKPPAPGETPYWETPHPAAEIRRLRTGRLASDDRLVTLAMAILGPDESTFEVVTQDIRLAREYGLITSAHTWGRKPRLVERGMAALAEVGLLGPDHNVTHGNDIEDDELKLCIDHGVSFTATPSTEMLNAPRVPLLGRLIDLGGYATLGTDVDVYMTGDMLPLLREAFKIQRMLDNQGLAARGAWPPDRHKTSPRNALEWATINNAKALRLDHKIGSITPGKQADLVLLQIDGIGTFPTEDPIHAIVLYAETAQVDTVLIAGKPVKQGGRLMYDQKLLAAKKADLAQSRRRIMAEGNYVFTE